MINCSGCKTNKCYSGEDCVQGHDFGKIINSSKDEYCQAENLKVLEVSSNIEGEHYMEWTRLEEIIGFAEGMGFKTIGIAHCVGLTNEAKSLKTVLDKKFTVYAVCCKFSGIDKKDFNLPQIKKDRFEAICNPIGQAMVLNDLKTDMNIIVGLCIGHDMLFTKFSDAHVTTFIVKDRITGHNPAITLYSKYYQKKFEINEII
ncbi:MAG: DUF1847 domain-containing protein [Bacteroidales bacterium]|nr:DUF1847 domain-containing protein [Bacteroidales bacterium]